MGSRPFGLVMPGQEVSHVSSLVESRTAPHWSTSLLVGGEDEIGVGPDVTVFNPATEQPIVTLASASPDQVNRAVGAARRAFDHGPWPRMAAAERSRLLHRFADLVEAMHDSLTAGCVLEIGTPLSMSETLQTKGAVAALRVYADLAGRDRTEELGRHDGTVPSRGRVSLLPSGVVAVVTAYNIPLAITARSMGGALAAGCTVVVLPSPRAPLTSLLMLRASVAAGIPEGVINVVVGEAPVGQQLTSHPDVDKIAFTGSVRVGRSIMAQAAGRLTRLSLELGGKAPTVLLPGVELAPIMHQLHARYVRNAGQGCMTPGRLLVHRDQYEEFVELSVATYARLKTGDPWERDTEVGPLIRPDHLSAVRAKVATAVERGASVLAEGPASQLSSGWFMSPVLLGAVAADSPIAQEEIFGPVGVVVVYDDVDHAVRLANGTDYGLSADVYAATTGEALALAPRLRAGAVVVNGGGTPRPGVPMGGFKASGFGREGGEWGVREFLETQYIQWPA